MAQFQLEIIIIASVVAAACSLVGAFLVLRRLSLLSDAISHSILFGIVLAFFLSGSTASVTMIVAATLTGVLTVYLVETIVNTRLVKEDAAIGLVFPALFALGVILISRYAANVHLDTDAVLLGELAFAPFNRLEVGGLDFGPQGLWLAGAAAVLNLAFIVLFYKELKLSTFDPALAAALGFSPVVIHYALMTLVSVTAVASFEAVGSVLVVALMIAPPSTAYLLTDRLPVMLGLGVLIGAASAVLGYFVARALDASIAGSITSVIGLIFLLVLLFAPRQGLVQGWLRRRRQRWQFAGELLLVHLLNHEADAAASPDETSVAHLSGHMRWGRSFAGEVVRYVTRAGLAHLSGDGRLALTEPGRLTARGAMMR